MGAERMRLIAAKNSLIKRNETICVIFTIHMRAHSCALYALAEHIFSLGVFIGWANICIRIAFGCGKSEKKSPHPIHSRFLFHGIDSEQKREPADVDWWAYASIEPYSMATRYYPCCIIKLLHTFFDSVYGISTFARGFFYLPLMVIFWIRFT